MRPWTVSVTPKMRAWAERRCERFVDSSRPNAVSDQRTRVLTGFLCEAAFWSLHRDATYVDEIDYDFLINDHKVDIKGKLCKHDPERVSLNFFINDTYIKKPFDGVYVFCFLSQDLSKVWVVGWETFYQFEKTATFIPAKTSYVQNGRSFYNKLDVWNMRVSEMRPVTELHPFLSI